MTAHPVYVVGQAALVYIGDSVATPTGHGEVVQVDGALVLVRTNEPGRIHRTYRPENLALRKRGEP